ncbi:MAG: hypothetical protein H7839_19585 [Magnetococcus sp. YQC-5]
MGTAWVAGERGELAHLSDHQALVPALDAMENREIALGEMSNSSQRHSTCQVLRN